MPSPGCFHRSKGRIDLWISFKFDVFPCYTAVYTTLRIFYGGDRMQFAIVLVSGPDTLGCRLHEDPSLACLVLGTKVHSSQFQCAQTRHCGSLAYPLLLMKNVGANASKPPSSTIIPGPQSWSPPLGYHCNTALPSLNSCASCRCASYILRSIYIRIYIYVRVRVCALLVKYHVSSIIVFALLASISAYNDQR